MPVDFASNLGGFMGRRLGPSLGKKSHKRAEKNLRLCFPEKSDKEINTILGDMWEHIGRVGGEFPVLAKITKQDRIKIVGQDLIMESWTEGRPTIFFSGHMGNWELAPALGQRWDMDMVAIYQPPTNRFIDRLTKKIRLNIGLTIVPRGPEAVDKAFRKLKNGGTLAFLADQRRTGGELVPFFGHPAKTIVTLGQIAMRFNCQVYPVRIVRTKGANFELRCYPAFEFQPSGDRKKDALEYMELVNILYEGWIREFPEQWLWPHRRWR
jgi:Kdo2-lipid IVA lauroyltransferase/acyltransferase